MAGNEVKIDGLDDLARALKALPAELASRNGGPLARALGSAARVIRNRAKQLAPMAKGPYKAKGLNMQPGRLKESIRAVRARKPQAGVNEQYVVKPFNRDVRRKHGLGVNYWHLIEFGFVHVSGKHVPAKPFLRPAYESEKMAAVDQFKKSLRGSVERIRKKIYRKRHGR